MHLFNQIAAAIFTFELQINLRLKLSLAITNGSICQYKTQPGVYVAEENTGGVTSDRIASCVFPTLFLFMTVPKR